VDEEVAVIRGEAPRALTYRQRLRRRRRWLTAGALLLLVLLVTGDYYLYPRLARPAGRSFNRGENALWLRYTWYFSPLGEAKLDELARSLRAQQIRYAYFHVRSIRPDGTLRFRFGPNARRLTDGLRRRAPGVKVMAWVYVGNEYGVPGESGVNIASALVRGRMVREALWLTRECGFDGVQWDYEVCPDRHEGFLRLMRETRTALPPGKLLGAAVPMMTARPLRRWGWSAEYAGRIARTCDQLAVMAYDSSLWLPRAYVWLVREQTVSYTRAVAAANPRCRVLIGVPTYFKGSSAHYPRAENLPLALKGVREGLADARAVRAVFAGVAPFADYTTQPAEWRVFHDLWLRRAPPVAARPPGRPTSGSRR
jgi:hypothetical protein